MRSTSTALLYLAGKILGAYERGDSVALTLICDLSKTVDVVSHELLIHKLSR